MITEQSGAEENGRIPTLQELLEEVAGSLQASSPKEEKFYRALRHIYLRPALTQERAADLLNLPFSTYRRHLEAGIERIADALWQREIGGP